MSVFLTCIVLILLPAALNAHTAQDEDHVTFSGKNVTFKTVFRAIRSQTGKQVFYSNNLLDDSQTTTVNYKDTPLAELLEDLFKNTPYQFKIEKTGVILIKTLDKPIPKSDNRGNKSTSMDTTVTMQSISGTVLAADGTPVIGASVMIKGSTNGTATDANGHFTLSRLGQKDVLLIRSVGFETREITVSGKNILIKLNVAVNELDETIIKGYYNTTKRLNTGNVSTITAEEIQSQPVSDPMAALIGRVPGLQVNQLSGAPGRAFNIQIRGRNSIANGSSPLVIVDGVPMFNNTTKSLSTSSTIIDNVNVASGVNSNTSPFYGINPNEIESIEILKDGDATAIYGSRGANGVILISTKTGQKGKLSFSGKVNQGVSHITRHMDLLDTKQYLQIRREAYTNDGITTFPSNAYDINGTWDTTLYTDWQKIFFGKNASYTDAQVQLSGGSEQTQFLISSGWHGEKTMFPGDFKDQKISTRLNITHKSIDQKLEVNASVMYSDNTNTLPAESFISLLRLAPNSPSIYNNNGSLNWANSTWTNPMSKIYHITQSKIKYLNSSLFLNYHLLTNLSLKGNVGYTNTSADQREKASSQYFNPANTSSQSYSVFGTNNIGVWNFEPQIDYSTLFKDIKIDVLVGLTLLQQLQEGKSFKGIGFSTDALLDNLQAAGTIQALGDSYSKYRYEALYSRLSFNLKDRYLLNFTGRRDGSSRFGPGKQFANFGAIGIGWIVSDYRFFAEHLKYISFAKLRASYGVTGNDQIGDYIFMDTYSPYSGTFNYLGLVGLQPTRLSNRDYAWETNKKLEMAVELGFIDNRIYLSANYYRNRSSNQLVNYPLPSQTGGGSVIKNLNALIDNKGWEFQLDLTNISNNQIKWTSVINFTIPQNKLISFPNLEQTSYASSYVVGQPLSIVKLLHYQGINSETGFYTFEDSNKDNQISNPADYTRYLYTGQQFYGGIGNNFSYKKLSLNIFFQYVRQNYVEDNTTLFVQPGYSISNLSVDVLNRWKDPGQNTQIQRLSRSAEASTAFSNYIRSDGVYQNASYLRLKTVNVNYQFNYGKSRDKYFTVNISAQNLWTVTGYDGFDPETKSLLPPMRTYTAGISFNL